MEYNKKYFKKTDDHKVLHKIRKHWVVVSVALLSIMGTAGITGHKVSANAINSRQPLQSANVSSASQVRLQKAKNNLSASANHSVQSDSSITSQANVLRNRILGQLRTDHSTNQTSSVTAGNAKSAASQVSNPLETGNPEDDLHDMNQQVSNLGNLYSQIANSYSSVAAYSAQSAAYSNEAQVSLSRYYHVYDKGWTSSGDSAGIFNDESTPGTASQASNRLQRDLGLFPLQAAVENSINADFTSSAANSVVDDVNYGNQTAQQGSQAIASLYNQMNETLAQINGNYNNAFNIMTDESNQASLITSDFASASAKANQMGSLLNQWNTVNSTTSFSPYGNGNPGSFGGLYDSALNGSSIDSSVVPTYAVADVSTGTEFNAAIEDPWIHQINIVNNIDLWHTHPTGVNANNVYPISHSSGNTNGYNWNNGNTDDNAGIPARNFRINGITNDGQHWNTIDLADVDYNAAQNAYPDRTQQLLKNSVVTNKIQNLHIYDTNFWGCFSMNDRGTPNNFDGRMIYDNISYFGSEMANDFKNNAVGNTDLKFEHRINIGTGNYSPDGKALDDNPEYTYVNDQGQTVPTGYGYDNGGIPGQPFVGDSGQDLAMAQNYNGNGEIPSQIYNINNLNEQALIECSTNVNFASNCNFSAHTNGGHCFVIDAVNYDSNESHLHLEPGAKVNLYPGGDCPEGTYNPFYGLPYGIYLNGNSHLDIDPGAVLNINPLVDDYQYGHVGPGGTTQNNPCAPGAIYAGGGASVTVGRGAKLRIDYSDLDKYYDEDPDRGRTTDHVQNSGHYYHFSLPDNHNGVAPIYLNGNGVQSHLHAEPYSEILVNGGNPGNAADNSYYNGKNYKNSENPLTDYGALVSYGETGNGIQNAVRADPNSTIKLQVGGTQPVTLFDAPNGSHISINNPRQFSLRFTNTNPKSQLAAPGVSIEGDEVTAYDDHVNDKGDFDHNFGQYSRIVLPGKQYGVPSHIINEITGTITQLYNASSGMKTAINQIGGNASGGSYSGILNTIMNDINHNNETDGADFLKLSEKAHLIPFGFTSLHTSLNDNDYDRFSYSVDLPEIIATSINEQVKKSAHTLALSDSQLANVIQKADQKYDPYYGNRNDDQMTYDSLNIPIHHNGFNITHGFAFKSVPTAYLEGVKMDSNGVVSGYANPGAYVRLMDTRTNQPITDSKLPVYNDKDSGYDPGDSNPYNYVAIADKQQGHWRYQVPAQYRNDPIRAVAHVATVATNPNAARLVDNYQNGMERTQNGHRRSNHDKVAGAGYSDQTPADNQTDLSQQYYLNWQYFPDDTYPGHQYRDINYANGFDPDDPANKLYDPTLTDDDDMKKALKYNDSTGGYDVDDITSSERGQDPKDDQNAGRYFQAGRLYGVYDLDNLLNDNSIYGMPRPFIIGYLTAKAETMDPQNFNHNIQTIINNLRNLPDYLPQVIADQRSAAVSNSAISQTISSLDSLTYNATDPYVNMASLANALVSPSSTDQRLLNNIGTSGQANSATQYSAVSLVDSKINSLVGVLFGYEQSYNNNANAYNNYYAAAKATKDSTQRKIDILAAQNIRNRTHNYTSAANQDYQNASQADNGASLDNNTASSDSSNMIASYDSIRNSASNSEANDFASVANSYVAWVVHDSQAAHFYHSLVSNRCQRLASASAVLSSDRDELNALSGKYTPAYVAGVSSGAARDAATSVSNAIAKASAALSNDQSTLNNDIASDQQYSYEALEADQNASYDSLNLNNREIAVGNYDSFQTNETSQAAAFLNQVLTDHLTGSPANQLDSQAGYDFDLANDLNSGTVKSESSGGMLASNVKSEATADSASGSLAWQGISRNPNDLQDIVSTVRWNARTVRSLAAVTQHLTGQAAPTPAPSTGLATVTVRYVDSQRHVIAALPISGLKGQTFDADRFMADVPGGCQAIKFLGQVPTTFTEHGQLTVLVNKLD